MTIRGSGIKTCGGEDAELVIPPHPELDVYPGWLRELALKRSPELKDAWPNSDTDAVIRLMDELKSHGWLDHWGTAVYDGKEFLVSEPYHMNRERVEELLRFCDTLDLAFNIQSSGHHNPTQTMRIFVWPKEWVMGDEFLQEDEGYADESPSPRECLANSPGPGETSEAGADSGFLQEKDLRDYLAANLQALEESMTLWPLDKDETAVEFPVGGGRRIDILGRDRSGLPVVIELKASRGHEKTVGQVLLYRNRVRELLKADRVRIVIVAREVSKELRDATGELPDVCLFEYRLAMRLIKV